MDFEIDITSNTGTLSMIDIKNLIEKDIIQDDTPEHLLENYELELDINDYGMDEADYGLDSYNFCFLPKRNNFRIMWNG